MRAATGEILHNVIVSVISIHAAHEGCDQVQAKQFDTWVKISIHAAHEGCDRASRNFLISESVFQSTLPEWAATELGLTVSIGVS